MHVASYQPKVYQGRYCIFLTASSNDGGGILSAIGHKFDDHSFTYTSRDVILYALGGKRSCDHTIMVVRLSACMCSWCYIVCRQPVRAQVPV